MTQRHAPSTGRNRSFILEVLTQELPEQGTVLEVASGSGEHAIYFAPALKHLTWQPSDITPENLASIDAWRGEFPSPNLLSPILLDVAKNPWTIEITPPVVPVSAVVNINMIHIAPWECCEGLFAGAARILPPEGVVYLYGPFRRGGEHTAASNEAFDAHLKLQDPGWGVRNLESVVELAASHDLVFHKAIEMPSNNLSVIFRRRGR